MKIDVLDLKGKKVREMELPAKLFEAPVNVDLMHQAYTRQMANARLGTHETKVRSEVRGGGRKPLETKRHRSCPPGIHKCSAMGWWWSYPYTPSSQL